MVEHSAAIGNLAAALGKVQAEVENAVKNSENSHFHNSYADLAEIINTVRPVLPKHGLSFMQFPGYNSEASVVTVTTIVLHASGEWIKGVAGAPTPKKDPQGVGSAVTYLRRYALAAVLGIAQEDDDGELASRREVKGTREHDDLLGTIRAAVKINPNMEVTIGGKQYELAAFLKKNAETVKTSLEKAREVAYAIAAESGEGEDL